MPFAFCFHSVLTEQIVYTGFRGPVVASFAFTVKGVGSNLMPGGLVSRKMGHSMTYNEL